MRSRAVYPCLPACLLSPCVMLARPRAALPACLLSAATRRPLQRQLAAYRLTPAYLPRAVRGLAFVVSPAIPPGLRGTEVIGLSHACDLAPTILEIAMGVGISSPPLAPGAQQPSPMGAIDGVSLLPMLCGGSSSSPPRTEIPHSVPKTNGTGRETPLFAPFIHKMHHFTKTGSGQNIGKALKKEWRFRRCAAVRQKRTLYCELHNN